MSDGRDLRSADRGPDGAQGPDEHASVPGKVTNAQLIGRPGVGPTPAVPGKRTLTEGLPDGGGAPLPGDLRSLFESSLGTNLGGVRVHTDDAAAQAADSVGARAFAVGNNIAFAQGTYAPQTAGGRELIAHEVAHTVQQRGGQQAMQTKLATTQPGDTAEQEADVAAKSMVTGTPASVSAQPVAIARDPSPAPAAGVTAPPPPVPGQTPEKGDHENQQIGTWDDTTNIATTTTIGLYNSEGEAMAAASTFGAVILEKGRYVAYKIKTSAWFESFTYENCKVLKGMQYTNVKINAPWLAVTTEDAVVLRPADYNTSAASSVMTPELMLKPGESPFGGFPELMGKGTQISDEKLIEAFTAAMKKGAVDVLAKSEDQVKRKRDQFMDKKGTGASEFKLIRDTAKHLAELDTQIATAAGEAMPPLSAHGQDVDTPEKQLKRDQARQRKEELEKQRKVVLNDYPTLARQDPKQIQNASDDEITKKLGDDTLQILQDIKTTRDNLLTGDIDLWGLPAMIDTTIAGCGITDQDRRDKIKKHAEALGKAATIKTAVKTVFEIGLGLLATFATGGLALIAAAGSLGLSAYDAAVATKEYGVDSAAANTNLDPELALAAKDMDGQWKWVLFAWVGVGLDASTVAHALKGVKSIEDVAKAADQIAKGSEALLAKLKVAANIVGDAEVVSETTRGVLGLKLGTSLEIRQGLGTEVRVLYSIDAETGRVTAKGVICGEKALVKDVLAHTETVKLLNRYEGVTGELRQLWERFVSLAPEAAKDLKNPFPPGSQAFESWFEVKKLPKIIESRMKDLEKGSGMLGKEAEDGLRREISVLQDDLARHKAAVDALAVEKGSGFIAKSEEATNAAKAAGYPWPPPGVSQDNLKYYYYRRNGTGFEFCTMQDAPADVKRFTLNDKTLVEGKPSAAQKAKQMVAGWPKEQQTAFEALQKLEEMDGVYRVVPLQGITKLDRTIGEAFTSAQKAQMIDIYKRAWLAKMPELGEAGALRKAKATVDTLMAHDVTLVQGTEQLRLFDYARNYSKNGGGAPIGELHHDIPLYLGGDHQMLTDIGKVKNPVTGEVEDLHDLLHGVLDKAKFPDGTTLAPYDLAKKIPTEPGAAVLKTDGTIQFYRMSGSGDDVKLVPIN
jgi:hypothetical protein